MIVYYCLATAMFIPLVLALSSIPFRVKQQSTVNINEPRAQAEQLTGAGGRLVAAQKNAWEALVLFAVALFIAYANNVDAQLITNASVLFITARIAHAIFYVLGWGILRLLSFTTAAAAITYIVFIALNAH